MPRYASHRNVSESQWSTHERALLVGVLWPGMLESLAREYLEELDLLAQTAGAYVAGRELARRSRPDAALLIGKGKAAELTEIADELRADVVIFDDELSPAQARNLEEIFKRRVIARTGLILDIFARRARTHEAKIQVELAQLRYLLPRLAGAWTHLERQRGGIGLRGPGETQIETDRRMIRTRIRTLEQELDHIERIGRTQRAGREGMYRFALAGYTNVGKSTLMNALTHAGVYEENLLFATLDSTTRLLDLGTRQPALLTDTVGFVRKLPHDLIASFRSTLAEIREANCIVHVVDVASPSFRDQMDEVERVLEEMGVGDTPRLTVFNKVDALEDDVHVRWATQRDPAGVFVSARSGQGIDRLLSNLRNVLTAGQIELSLDIPLSEGKLLAQLRSVAEILKEEHLNTNAHLIIRLREADARRLRLL